MVKFKKGDFLQEEGDKCNIVRILLHGCARGFVLVDGKEITTNFYFEFDHTYDYINYLKQQRGNINIQALDDIEAIELSMEALEHLDGLMCNAGMVNMENKPKFTKDGFEITMAASFFGHFLLIELLLDLLKKSAPSRIGILSSVVHAGSPKKRHYVHLDNLNYENCKYNNFDAYGEAKVANVQYALELANRLKGTGVTTASILAGQGRILAKVEMQ